MGNYSYVQTDFRGGVWSPNAQGRMTDPTYKTAMQTSLNGWPTEEGAWQRRPGFRLLAHTYRGQPAILRQFRFKRQEAYQAEINSAGKLRFYAGLELLMDETSEPQVVGISAGSGATYGWGNGWGLAWGGLSPQAIVEVDSLPAGWVDGDTVIFNIVTDGGGNAQMPSSYTMFNRQFEIVAPSGNTFGLRDPITQQQITASELNYILRSGTPDTVQKVLTFAAPWTTAEYAQVRIVQAIKDVIFLIPGKRPKILRQSGTNQFTFEDFLIEDGPYFDTNTTETLLEITNSDPPLAQGATANITASDTVGINDGDGFKSTDVGRILRFRCGPPEWDAATTFTRGSKCIAPSGNIFRALKTSTNQNPDNDDGTFWEITADTFNWAWLTILTVTSTTTITARVESPDGIEFKNFSSHIWFSSQTIEPSTKSWRLGVYCDTVGWPTCGAYFEGRLSLSGAVENRVDMSRSLNEPDPGFHADFAPTMEDGTVADDNGVSFVINSRDNDAVAWLQSQDNGLAIGTFTTVYMASGSQISDPITPFDTQVRPIPSASGCANVEAVNTFSTTFVQARQRKIMALRANPNGGNFVEAQNLSWLAENLMAPAITRVEWMQEPALSIFATRSDGALVGAVYKWTLVGESYIGWHTLNHALGRKFEDVSAGPSFQGTGDCIYVVTADAADTTKPRWVETMMPVASSGSANWLAWHTDASTTGGFVRRMIVANGDSFDGLRVYGLELLNGVTVHPWIGSLDIGDKVVANGFIDLPFGTPAGFTLAFLQGLDDGTDYGEGEWGMKLRWADVAITTPSPYPLNTVGVMNTENSVTTVPEPSSTTGLWAENWDEFYHLNTVSRSVTVLNDETGEFIREADANKFFGSFVGTDSFSINSGEWVVGRGRKRLFGATQTDLNPPFAVFDTSDADDMTMTGRINQGVVKQPGAEPFCVRFNDLFGIDPDDLRDYAVYFGRQSANVVDHIYVIDLEELKGDFASDGTGGVVLFHEKWDGTGGLPTETSVWGALGRDDAPGHSTFLVCGSDGDSGDLTTATRINLYTFDLDQKLLAPGALVTHTGIRKTLTPTMIDDGWTSFERMTFTRDLITDGWIGIAKKGAGTGPEYKMFRLEAVTFDLLYSVALSTDFPLAAMFHPQARAAAGVLVYIDNLVTDNVAHVFDLTSGLEINTISGQIEGFSGFAGSTGNMIMDEDGQSLVFWGGYNGLGNAVPLGEWATDKLVSPGFWQNQHQRLWLGFSFTQDQDHREMNADLLFVPVNFGTSFTSRGQILRPDFGIDAGARAGPAFGKLRRTHRYAARFYDSYNVTIGTDFSKLDPILFTTVGGTPISPPTRFTGTAVGELEDDYSWEGALAWEVTRQYPVTLTAIGGYVASSDK